MAYINLNEILTELDAVNAILDALGYLPVTTLTAGATPLPPEVVTVQKVLARERVSLQSGKWSFNKFEKIQLPISDGTPEGEEVGDIPLADNVINVTPTYPYEKYVVRGRKVYDVNNQTYTFTTSPYFTVSYDLDFEDLPQPARELITAKAGAFCAVTLIADYTMADLMESEAQNAQANLMDLEIDETNSTFLDGLELM